MEIFIIILASIFFYVISCTVHELGHILMGIKEGFKFYLLVVGPFGFKRDENDKIVFYIEKDVTLWGGLGATLPTNDDADNYRKFGRVLLAGPFASIIFGLIWLPLAIITKNIFLILLSAMSLAIGIVCLLPLRNGAFYTDGGRWLRMHKKEKTRAVEMAIWNFNSKLNCSRQLCKIKFR